MEWPIVLWVGSAALTIFLWIRDQKRKTRQSKHKDFLAGLKHGKDMLYSGDFSKQKVGVEDLHNLAETNKKDRKKVKEVFEVLRVFVKEIHVDKEERPYYVRGKKMYPEVVINQEILYKITPPEESIYSEVNLKIDLGGAQLYGEHQKLNGAYLPGNKVCLKEVYLQGANLAEADLSGVDLSNTNLSRANLNGANLSNTNLSGTDLRGTEIQNARNIGQVTWTNARLNYAFADSKDKDKLTKEIGAKGVEDIIWTNNQPNNHLSWRGEKGLGNVIASLKQELEKETDNEMQGIISFIIGRFP